MRLRSREAGSANSSVGEARPNCGQKRKAEGPFVGSGEDDGTKAGPERHQWRERVLHFGEGIHEETKLLLGDRYQGGEHERIVVEGEGLEMGCGEK